VFLHQYAKFDAIRERIQTMKRLLLTLLGIVLVLGLFAAAGYTGYRFGYAQGAQAAVNGNASPRAPALRPFDDFGPRGMPDRNFDFDRGLRRGFGPGRFPIMGFGFFPLMFLGRILVLALIIGFIVWLVTRSGWRLTRTPIATTTTTPPPSAENQNTEANQ
jgi:hypothetical protein